MSTISKFDFISKNQEKNTLRYILAHLTEKELAKIGLTKKGGVYITEEETEYNLYGLVAAIYRGQFSSPILLIKEIYGEIGLGLFLAARPAKKAA